MKKKKIIIFLCIFICVISIDQGLKIWVANNMHLHEIRKIPFFNYFLRLNYILNPGLINGFLIGGDYSKILFLIFRIIVIFFIFKFTIMSNKQKSIIDIIKPSLIISGGIGNTIDWIFYGIFFNNSPSPAPFKFGYGQVVDMLQFKIPSFLPIIGGRYSTMIFNIADVAIAIGIILYLFSKNNHKNNE